LIPASWYLDFGGCTDFDDSHTAGQFGDTLLQFFAVVIRRGFFDLHADLFDAGFDVGSSTGAIDDGGVFFAHFDALGRTQISQSDFFQGQTDFFGDDFATGQNGDVFQHGFAAVAEARGLDSHHFQNATDGVDHQGCQRFAVDFFGNDQQRTAGFGHGFQGWQQFANVADFFVKQQYERVVQQRHLFVVVVDEVR